MMDGFDAYSESYESHVERSIGFLGRGHDFYTRAKADRLIEQLARRLGAPRTLRVLDVGCGIGETDRFLKDRLGALRGADVSAESVERARRDNPGIPYDVIDGTTFPYADDSFDAAFAACVFHHVPPDQRLRLMEEIRRVLRPGGLMILFEHNPWQPLTRLEVSRCFPFGAQYFVTGVAP
jgi:SAM-dependent methyltransferase